MDRENGTPRQINRNNRAEKPYNQKPNPTRNNETFVRYNPNKSSQSTMPLALQDFPSKKDNQFRGQKLADEGLNRNNKHKILYIQQKQVRTRKFHFNTSPSIPERKIKTLTSSWLVLLCSSQGFL